MILAITEAYREACSMHGCKVDYQWLTTALMVDYDLVALNRELRNFNEYWSDQPRRHKSVKRTIRNWMKKAIVADLPLAVVSDKLVVPEKVPDAVELVDLEEARSKWAGWLELIRSEYYMLPLLGWLVNLEPCRKVDRHTYKAWYAASRAVGFASDATLIVELPNDTCRQWLEGSQDQPPFKVRYQTAEVPGI